MTNITTEIKNFVILFLDGSKKNITSDLASSIINLPADATQIEIDGCFYKLHQISKILTIEKYYEEYPKEKPPVYDDISKYTSPIQAPTVNAKELMIKGFRQYCKEHPKSLKAKAILKKYDGDELFSLVVADQSIKI